MIRDNCGITPEALTLRWKISAYPASESTPSWIRAPPESLSPMTGAPTSMALSMIFEYTRFLARGGKEKKRGGYLADLGGIHLGEGATEDGKVLAKDKRETAVDGAVSGHDAIARVLDTFAKKHERKRSIPFASPSQSRCSCARQTCHTRGTSPRPEEGRCARVRSACPAGRLGFSFFDTYKKERHTR